MESNFTFRKTKTSVLLLTLALFLPVLIFAQTKHIVEVSNNKYSPKELQITVGDTVEWKNIQGYHNVNGKTSTFPSNPESFGNALGTGWTYKFVFNVPGKYDYQCDPHVGWGMVGKIEVKDAGGGDDDDKFILTVNFTGMTPHVGQTLWLAVKEKDSGKTVDRKSVTVSTAFTMELTGLEMGHSYWVDFFSDHNKNGIYDAPPADHAWRREVNNVAGNSVIDFAHNTGFTNIEWENMLTVHLMNMNPHVGQTLRLWVVDKETKIVVDSASTLVTADFPLVLYGIVSGKSYNVDFYADHNKNGQYDTPPTDHAWRLNLDNVVADTSLMFMHNTSFTDIFATTPVNQLEFMDVKIFPNPTSGKFYIEKNGVFESPVQVSVFDLTGKIRKNVVIDQNQNSVVDIEQLPSGIYFIDIKYSGKQSRSKLVKY